MIADTRRNRISVHRYGLIVIGPKKLDALPSWIVGKFFDPRKGATLDCVHPVIRKYMEAEAQGEA
jgi:hypothetical protein